VTSLQSGPAMRIGFAGTPGFAAAMLIAMLDAGRPVALALAQPDRPRGRGMATEWGPVASLARAEHIPLFQPQGLKTAEARTPVTAIPIDLLVVAAYGLILPPEILAWPVHGCINVHASLLPRWRGAAPIERALLAGDDETGISIMQMDAGLDTGPVIARYPVPIAGRDTAGALREKLARAGAKAIVETLARLEREGRLETTPQSIAEATHAPKIDRREAVIDWRTSAHAVDRAVRAFNPVPGARTTLDGELIKIWEAEAGPGRFGEAGAIVRADANGIVVACGEGALLVRELQRASGKRMPVAAFLTGHPLAGRARFGPANG
jgi:methionyl-tRNA formyltransferase